MTELEAFAAHWRLLGQSEHCLECYLGVLRRLGNLDAGPLDLRAYLAERAKTVSVASLRSM